MIPTARLSAALAGRYEIERELGAGGMATVYLANDLRHGRRVAVKVLRPELSAILGGDRFLQEIRLTANLQHPHILPLFDSGTVDGLLFYVMPFVEGESLRQRLQREKQVPVEDAIAITRGVAAALDYAHRRGIIHRDIKPENILLHEGQALVADFGIALAFHSAGSTRLTETGLSLGTPYYMSPEQATADRELDPRSDIYSLGAVLYEMLAGEPPHTGATAQAVIARILSEPTPRLRATRPNVPEHIDVAVRRALERVPADRFGSAAEFAAALEGTSRAAGVGRRPRGRLFAAGLVGAVAVAVIAAIWRPWRQPQPAVVAEASPSVAVLAFDNLTGNPNDQYLSDGMTEEVIGQLARVQGLKVISRTSTEALKGTRLTSRQIADTLGVRHLLEGSIRHVGSRIRVEVALIDATTDDHVWSSTYNRDLTDVFAVQEEIARQVADTLGSVIGLRPAIGRVVRTENPEAQRAYLSGRSLFYRRSGEGMRRALEQFQLAIAGDSSYAPAYAGLASLYQLWVFYGYPGIDFYEAYGRALVLADRAIALDPDLAEAYAARGRALSRAWAPAEEIAPDFRRALQLRPNSVDTRQWYALFLAREGRHAEALAESEHVLSLDPLAPGVRVAVSGIALGARRSDMATQEAERALALEPGLIKARELQALGDLLSNNAARCTTLRLGPYDAVRAMCLHSMGKEQEARRIVDSLRAAFTAGAVGDSTFRPVIIARGLMQYYAWTGNATASLEWLERAYAISPEGDDATLWSSGLYDKIRDDPRFKAGRTRLQAQVLDRVRRARLQAR